MISGEDHDRVPPQIHFVQDIHNLPNAAFTVLDGVQIIVVEDGPHILAICGNRARPAVPALLVFQERTRHAGGSERFREACWKCEGPFLFVDRVWRGWRHCLWHHCLLNLSLAGDVPIPEHDVVRIDETRYHEEGLAGPACFSGGDAQPAHAFASDERIVLKATSRSATDVTPRTEYIEAVGLSSQAVVDRGLGAQDPFVHLELAKVRCLVAEPFQHGPTLGMFGSKVGTKEYCI